MNTVANKDNVSAILERIHSRKFYSKYNENPKFYPEESMKQGEKDFHAKLNENYTALYNEGSEGWIGEEVSPFLQVGLGIRYPKFSTEKLISNAVEVKSQWAKLSVEKRAEILMQTLDAIEKRFSEITYATIHTTGQSFLMAFQSSGPHALDRALEAIEVGLVEQIKYTKDAEWVKNLGKFDLAIEKNYKPIPRGIGLLIGCTTFPVWNSLPGLYANLITGNAVIWKPHPKAVYPMAIVVEEIQNTLTNNNLDKRIVQLAVDTSAELITKELCENPAVKLIDYTGSNAFGDYVESLSGKISFTEKAGVNSVILDSCDDINKTAKNLAFSVSLYSGQMCTAPQNVYISESGIDTPEGKVSFDEFKNIFAEAVKALVHNPKGGAHTIGAIQNDRTFQNIQESKKQFSDIVLDSEDVKNPEFEHARIQTPILVAVDSSNKDLYWKEHFGPFSILIKTKNFEESLSLAAKSAVERGAITCLAYCTDENKSQQIEDVMNDAFTPVSFNFAGAAFVNQHAAFSDLHVTGGNPAGNATFTDSNFVNKRFVWVGNRYMK